MGLVFADVQVPDYSARALAISGLLLADEAARRGILAAARRQLPAGTLPAPATSRRAFSQTAP